MSLGSIQFKFIETFTKPSLFPIFRFVVETLWSRQYQTSGFEKLIRIDRLVKEWCE
jgi:hypothetical protein